ncbi:uncharacterized protein Hap1MRO34_020036 [Clarias gariepinus]
MVASLDLIQLGSFFTAFNQTSKQMNSNISTAISEIILNVTLLNLAPDFQSFSPEEFALWFQTYLSFFLPVIGPNTLSVIPMNISGDSYREIVIGLDNVYSHLTNTQSNTVFNHTLDYLQYQSSQGLRYYSSGSFFMFLNQFFRSFGFPNLKDFLSLIPADRQAEILDSISVEELSEFLNRPDAVTDGAELCTLLNNYNMTNQYLEREPVLSSALASLTLACVWPQALRASSPADVEQWFDFTLVNYLPYLTFQLISSTQLSEASCLSYRKLVSVLGKNYNFSATNFAPADVYSSIRAYLTNNDGRPRCFNSSDPLLNSTAWFADNIGFFITFISLSDLHSFLSGNMTSVLLENSENLQLFNNSGISAIVLEYYTTELYTQNPDFSPLRLPAGLLCHSPSSMFDDLGDSDVQTILRSINNYCTAITPEVTAVLVAKVPNISASTIQSLGSQCVGLTVGQISSAPSNAIISSLSTLSNISGWDQGQVNALIQSIINAGFNVSSASSLVSLGTLISGVPSATISNIPFSEILSLSQNPTFINNILSAPTVLQETFVQKIISVDQTEAIANVPGGLVMYIPLVLLTSLSSKDISLINTQSWSHKQSCLVWMSEYRLSVSVLQGFSCSAVQTLPLQKTQDLVRACRPRAGRDKVLLEEAQLVCMYNFVKDDPSFSFTDVPSDLLLYYSYENIQKETCQSYFTALGRADFSILSSVLDKQTILFNAAKDCLDISGVSLTRDQVAMLGNMACTLDASYIQNSDPLILENLKNCGDLSDSQITAVLSLLLSGNTAYGNPSTWNEQTVHQLGILAVYFTSDLCDKLSFNVKREILSVLREQKIPIKILRTFFTKCNSEDATVSDISAVTISDPSFPFGFNSTQFDLYLDISVLQYNLAAITEKVVDISLQTVILKKLNQIYPSGLDDGVLQLLGSTSRVATTDDISKWNINMIDTLYSLMDPNNGPWDPHMSQALIMRYLSTEDHYLESAEINAIGSNICTLNVSVLQTITAESLKTVLSPDLSSCSIEQKSVLYIIANSSFSNEHSNTLTFYQLIRPYLGGAPLEDIQALSTQNIIMDITTFISLNPAVLMMLNVSTVRGLMGVNIAELQLFENSSVVQSWVSQQNQSDLNTLNLGIINHNPCFGVDSQQLHGEIASGNVSAVLCNFSIPDYACSSAVVLTSDDLATLLTCELSSSVIYSKEAWRRFFQNFAGPLDEALDRFSIMNISSIQSDPNILDAIGEVIISNFNTEQLMNVTFISKWFQVRLRPFLSSVSTHFLSSLSSKNFNCKSYQVVVEALSSLEPLMNEDQKHSVFTTLIFPFLSRVDLPDPGCVSDTSGSNDWLKNNLRIFSVYASLEDLRILNANFSSVAVLGLLSSEQKAQFILQPDSGVLGNESVFREVFSNMVASLDLIQLGSFFTAFNQTSKQMNSSISTAISEIILNVTLLNLAPDFQSFSPEEFALWFQTYLSFFLPVIGPNTLSVIPMNISGDSYREIVIGLDNVYSHLTNTQSNTVFNHTLDYLQYQSSQGLRYYSSGSFFMFLNQFFRSFGFPNLKDFLSLIPADRQAEILDSISVEELSEFLNRPDAVTDGAELCTLLNNYNMTNQYLEREPVLSSALASLTLACVWPQALRASSPADVEQWFDFTLVNYLPYLTFQLISSTQLSEASCLSYRKLVSVLGKNYNFSATNFAPADVYSSIRAYLTNNDGRPRCFNSSDPLLNSTAWFADNIGFFITFISLSDLHSFLSGNMTSVLLENSENLQLFNNSGISAIVLEYYTTELYTQNPDFSPLRLPAGLLCHSPSSMFDDLGDSDVQTILRSINNYCTAITPEVTAVLVAKVPNISASTIQSLGSQCVGLTVGQISSAPSNAIISSLSTLSNISGWDQGQVNALIQSIINAGFNVSSASSLVSLGTLISGVPSATISNIPYSEIVSLSQNPTFINNILSAPTVLQETFVQKIISVDQTEAIANVPGGLVMYIPLVLLTSLSSEDISLINTQSWSHKQAVMLFGAVASASDNPEDLSVSVLQGFSCSAVQTLPLQKTQDLVRACRPRAGRDKVLLEEAQLVCMYNFVKDDPSFSFTDVPSDLLLYYSYENIQKETCQSYFTALGRADFSILSSVLDKQTILFNAAKDCLDISGVSLTRDQVAMLGNMACTLDASYIQNSDPLILENLKNCGDLSDSQITAVLSLLLSGNTAYGNPSTWNEQTVHQLGILAVYFTSDLCDKLSFNVKREILSVLREQKIPIKILRTFFTKCNSEDATVSDISAVTISDPSFPFGFNSTQFDLYLDISVLQYNLAAITEKVVDISLQTVILKKLNQIYPSGLDDGVLQLLGSTSRVATTDDISKWNINMIDTLYSLMDPNNGPWDPHMSQALIMRYLSTEDHYLESAEINAIGSNICTLNVSVLQTITAESLKTVLSPDLSSCSIEQKSVLYIIANSSFSNEHSNTLTFYQLIRPYLGGAPLEDIQALSTQNIIMDITTFISLNPAVLKMLNVSTVRGLMGVNIAELQLFENSSVVQSWVSQQNQSDLNTLNLGIINHNPCFGVDSQQLHGEIASGNVSAVLCNFSIPDYACSSAVVLTSDDLATLLTCELSSSVIYSKEAWRRFFQNFAGPLDEALDRFSIMNISSIQSDPNILDAIGEVIISNFNTEQLMNVTFISKWFQVRLRPFLSSVSTHFLSSLSSKNFNCKSYQVV